MKKIFLIILVYIIFQSVCLAETTQPFDLWCKSYKREIANNDKVEIKREDNSYQLRITEDQAYVIGYETSYKNLIKDKSLSNDTEYFFSNVGFGGKNTVDSNGVMFPFDTLSIDRTNGETLLLKFTNNVEKIFMKCTKDKPKVLF